jgi:hypothetical protein
LEHSRRGAAQSAETAITPYIFDRTWHIAIFGCTTKIGRNRRKPTWPDLLSAQPVVNDPLLTSVRHVFAPQQLLLARSSDMFGRPQKV